MLGPIFGRRRKGAKPRRPALGAPEALESRRVLSSSPLGFSPPDLTVVGSAPAVASYGGVIGVSVDVVNLGATSITEPPDLNQGAPSFADASPSFVGVYLSTNPRRLGPGAIRIGQIAVPTVPQNSVVTLSANLPMPAFQPPGFPPNGNKLYVYYRADDFRQVADANRFNNVARADQPVQLAAPLPEIRATVLETPPVMQPGDVISPTIRLANLGTTGIPPQGPLVVQLVASTDDQFGPTDVVLATVTIDDLPPLSLVPTRGPTTLGGIDTLDDPANVFTAILGPVSLPPGTTGYFLGVAVDPVDAVREISEIGQGPSSQFDVIARVGDPIPGLPPAGVVSDPAPGLDLFPTPPFGPLAFAFQPTDLVLPTLPTFPTGPGSPVIIFGRQGLAARRAAFAARRLR